MNPSPPGSQSHRPRRALAAGLLLLVTAAVYWPVVTHDFINYDDHLYVTENGHVQNGLTGEAIRWAFTAAHACNWHPLTWLSHLLDVQLFGLQPAGHHLTSLLFHLANTLLLFVLLNRLTGALWRSAFVAALFALHPTRVESVAWIAERKDVLSTCFGLLTLWAYTRYAQKSEERRAKGEDGTYAPRPRSLMTDHWSLITDHGSLITDHGSLSYALALLCFALGLMSKPMLVTLPFVLLLLDGWPLRRLQPSTLNPQPSTLLRLVREKLPFFALAAASSAVTYWAQKAGDAVSSWELLPFRDRLANAAVSYVRYLGKALWPADLTVIDLHPGKWPAGSVAGSALLLAILTLVLLGLSRRRPYLAVGWLWFLGTLVPVIGLVQVGIQAMADRYTYIPFIGLFLLLTWGMADVLSCRRRGRTLLAGAALTVVAACAATASFQVKLWRDSETLFSHALQVTPHNHVALVSLGQARSARADWDGAIECYQQVLRLKPGNAETHVNLGNALASRGDRAAAFPHYAEALRLRPDYSEAYYNLGNAFAEEGNLPEAEKNFRAAIRVLPNHAEAYNHLGNLLVLQGRMDEAIGAYQSAIRIRPGYADAHYFLGTALARQNNNPSAIAQFRLALNFNPDYPAAANDLAWILATATNASMRNVDEAIRLATRACRQTANQEPLYLDTLAAALAGAGRFAEAIATAQQAVAAARAAGDAPLAARLAGRLAAYSPRAPASNSVTPVRAPDSTR